LSGSVLSDENWDDYNKKARKPFRVCTPFILLQWNDYVATTYTPAIYAVNSLSEIGKRMLEKISLILL